MWTEDMCFSELERLRKSLAEDKFKTTDYRLFKKAQIWMLELILDIE